MSLTFTPFPMYDFPEVAAEHDVLWRRIVAIVRRSGYVHDVPLTQICGYPLATSLRFRFDVIAAPVYDVPFSRRAAHCGLIVVAADAEHATLEDLRGTRFALNAWDSNTGMNLPRHLFAPLAKHGRFFSGVVETGSHVASLAAVRTGAADVASIDNVTFALLAEHRPSAVKGVRVLTSTVSSPTLPFVTPSPSTIKTRAVLYDALASAIDLTQRSQSTTALHLAGVERSAIATYDPLLRLEDAAANLGYGTLA
jgi:ABC-type phosphate/phosphonate transport system substrate-binding protein